MTDTKSKNCDNADNPDAPPPAQQATDQNSMRLTVPGFGPVTLPPPEQIAYLAGLAALTVLEIIEWPVALLLGAAHLLADQRHNKILHDFGEALEEA